MSLQKAIMQLTACYLNATAVVFVALLWHISIKKPSQSIDRDGYKSLQKT
jgi:hypothetical protein